MSSTRHLRLAFWLTSLLAGVCCLVSSASSHTVPLYVEELYSKLSSDKTPRFQNFQSPGQFHFNAEYGNAAEQISNDYQVMKEYLDSLNSDGWQPFRRELTELQNGASAFIFTANVTTINVSSHHHHHMTSNPALERDGESGAKDSIDVIHFSLGEPLPQTFTSASLDFWWEGVDASELSSAAAENLVLRFELGLKRDEKQLRTAVKSIPVTSLPNADWLSVDVGVALQVWEAFISSSNNADCKILDTDTVVGHSDFALRAFLTDTSQKSHWRKSLVLSHAVSVDPQKKPLLSLTLDMPQDELPDFELTEEGIQHIVEEENRQRQKRDADDGLQGPSWANGQKWSSRARNCQLFSYEIDKSYLRLNGYEIISPPYLTMNMCSGQCLVPFIREMNASTHATLAKLWAQKEAFGNLGRNSYDEPELQVSCVPINFMSLQILAFPDGDALEKARILPVKDLTASSCGCR